MKLLPILLINIVCVAGGLFIYDNIRSNSSATHSEPVVASAQSPGLTRPEPAVILGGGVQAELATLREQANAQAQTIQQLSQRLVGWTRLAADRAHRGPLAGLDDEGNSIDEGEGPFREGTVLALRSYMAEIRRRDVKARQEQRVAKIITAAGIELTDDNREAVIGETIGYQDQARDIIQSPIFPRDAAGMEQRRKAFESLRANYADQIRKMLPIDDADKLLASPLAQTAGYFRKARDR